MFYLRYFGEIVNVKARKQENIYDIYSDRGMQMNKAHASWFEWIGEEPKKEAEQIDFTPRLTRFDSYPWESLFNL